jgi:protease-4
MNPAPQPTPPADLRQPVEAIVPPRPPYPPPRRSAVGSFFGGLGRMVSALSTLVNLILLILVISLLVFLFTGLGKTETGLYERYYGGNKPSANKVAIIRVEGVLFEGFTDYAVRQIEAAAQDPNVKAVVLRIVSPGGTITASDMLHKRLGDLRNGKHPRHPGTPKPVVVSMGSIAASGGYYIAMIKGDRPTVILAEPTTVTGSIGVYASFPNVAKFANEHGIKWETIKAGDIKTSGSPFHDMSREERQVWGHIVDHAYLRFLGVIEEARGLSKEKMQEDIVINETVPIREGKQRAKHVHYSRYRADGGIYTAEQAVRYGLVDRIGYLHDALKEAADEAGLGDDYRAITYDKPRTLLGSLLGIEAAAPGVRLDAEGLAAAAAPRLWYLAPQHDLAGALAALGR